MHYLILCGAESVLPRLFRQVVIPPTVFRELQQPNTPPLVQQWARSLPVGQLSPSDLNSKTGSAVVVGSGSDQALPIWCV